MKKLLILATAALLVSGFCLGNNGGDKGKKKAKRSAMHTCPGKECSRKKG